MGVSRSQDYRLIKRAWRQIHDDIEGPDLKRQEMLAWCVQTLIETAGQAKGQRNPGAVVAAIRQLDWICSLGIILIVGTTFTDAPTECLQFLHAEFAASPVCSAGEIRSGG